VSPGVVTAVAAKRGLAHRDTPPPSKANEHYSSHDLRLIAPAVDKPPAHRTSLWTAPTGSVA